MKSKYVKKALTTRFKLPVRCRTIPGSNLIEAWVPWASRSEETEFPLALRRAALKLEYPNITQGWGLAGNIGLHGITLRAPIWDRVLAIENKA